MGKEAKDKKKQILNSHTNTSTAIGVCFVFFFLFNDETIYCEILHHSHSFSIYRRNSFTQICAFVSMLPVFLYSSDSFFFKKKCSLYVQTKQWTNKIVFSNEKETHKICAHLSLGPQEMKEQRK